MPHAGTSARSISNARTRTPAPVHGPASWTTSTVARATILPTGDGPITPPKTVTGSTPHPATSATLSASSKLHQQQRTHCEWLGCESTPALPKTIYLLVIDVVGTSLVTRS